MCYYCAHHRTTVRAAFSAKKLGLSVSADDQRIPAPAREGKKPRRSWHHRWTSLLVAGMATITLLAMQTRGFSGPIGQISTADGSLTDDLGPYSSALSEMKKAAKKAKTHSEEAASRIGSDTNPPAEPLRSLIALDLDVVEATINEILDPSVDPNLNPPDAGTIDLTVMPQTLPEYAAACAELANEAVDRLEQGNNDAQVGTCFKTIKSLLPAYRQLLDLNGSA